MSKWIIGKYIRLSLADRDLSRNDKKAESESVSHQKELIRNLLIRIRSFGDPSSSSFSMTDTAERILTGRVSRG